LLRATNQKTTELPVANSPFDAHRGPFDAATDGVSQAFPKSRHSTAIAWPGSSNEAVHPRKPREIEKKFEKETADQRPAVGC